MAYLVLVRHAQSEWNAMGLWTGWHDSPLSEKGRLEARKAARQLKDITFHQAHSSKLSRATQTLDEIKKALELSDLPVSEHEALNERNYGDYTGKNKWKIKEELGNEEFQKIRRHWEHPIPNGETMKDVHGRVVPYYEQQILNDLKAGKNIIISAHGNSLRALVKHLEDIADDEIHKLEIGTGEVLVYEISSDGRVLSKTIRSTGGKA